MNCAAVGAFFRPVKRARRNSRGDVLRAKVVEQHSKTTLGLLENATATLPQEQSDQVIDEDLRLSRSTELIEPTQVREMVSLKIKHMFNYLPVV